MDLVSQNTAGNKVKVTLSISEEARLKAKKMGLNMSSILENTLIHGLFSPSDLCISIYPTENAEILPKTELFSTNDEVLTGVECARFGFDTSETEKSEFVILPYSLLKDLISEGFSTDFRITKSKRELYISIMKHSHLIHRNLKHDNAMLDLKNIHEIDNNYDDMPFVKYIRDIINCEQNEKKTVERLPKVNSTTNHAETLRIKELFAIHRAQFITWAKKSIKTEKTLNDCVKVLERMNIIRPSDILHFESVNGCEFNSWHERSLLKFFRFLEYSYDGDDEPTINGFSLDLFRKKLSVLRRERRHTPTTNPKQKAISKGIKDAKELTKEDILEEFNLIPEQLKNFYKLLVYSGVRASQLYRLLESKNKVIEDKGTFIKVSAENVQIGNKKLFIGMYAPKECLKYIKTFRPSAFRTENNVKFSYENVCIRLKNNLSSGRRITSKSLRKFNLNFMRQNGVSGEIADFIQSRSGTSIREIHYENKNPLADEAYEKVVSKFLEFLPF